MSRKIIFVFSLILTIVFFIGYSIGTSTIPFDDSIKELYHEYFKSNYDKNKFDSIDPIFFETNVPSLIKISDESDILEKRNSLIQFIWHNDGFPYEKSPSKIDIDILDHRYKDLTNLERMDKITVSMEYGIESYAYLFLPVQKNNDVIIYHQGHSGDFIKGKKTIDFFLQRGYSVMAFSMPLMGMNNQPVVNLPNFGIIKLIDHNHFHFLDSNEFSSLKFFLEPIAISINYLENAHNFDLIHMVGISGGGWTTHLYSAIDERISHSYPVGAALPSYIRLNIPENGDYEKNLADLYLIANLPELFVMGGHGDNREQVKIINKFDRCCNSGITYQTFEDDIMNTMSKLGRGSFKIFLDETHKDHKISDSALETILKSIEN